MANDRLIELLDRKFRFLSESAPETFIHDLERFIRFLTEDYVVRDYTFRLQQELEEACGQYEERLGMERKRTVELRLLLEDRRLARIIHEGEKHKGPWCV